MIINAFQCSQGATFEFDWYRRYFTRLYLMYSYLAFENLSFISNPFSIKFRLLGTQLVLNRLVSLQFLLHLIIICLIQVIQLLIFVLPIFALFFQFHTKSPFYDTGVQKYYSSLYAILFWTSSMLIFAVFMENSVFHGSLVVWIMMIPFILLIILDNKSHGLEPINTWYLNAKNGNQIAA